MSDLQQTFDSAVRSHQAGDLRRAEQLYRQMVADDARHADALHHLGLLCRQQGDAAQAVTYIRQALQERPNLVDAHYNLGNALSELGKLEEAAASYTEAVRLRPSYLEAHNNLGNALKDLGRLEEAMASYREAVRLRPDQAGAHYNLGSALLDLSRSEEAEVSLREALRLQPDFAAAQNSLGTILAGKGHPEEAAVCFRKAILLRSEFVDAHINLANVLNEQGELAEAVGCYRQALRLKPDYAEAHNNLAIVLAKQGKSEEAIASYCRAILLKPSFPEAHHNLANVYHEQGKLDEAIVSYRRALYLKPGYAEAHNNLGNALRKQEKFEEAFACFRQALRLKPGYAEAYHGMGNAFKEQGKLEDAVACYRQALLLNPDYPIAHNNLGNALKDQGNLEEAVACYRQALHLKPDLVKAHSNFVFTLSYCLEMTLADLAEAHEEFNHRHADPMQSTWRPHDNLPEPNRQLRLGFVSADLGRHPVGYFLVRILEHLDRRQAEIVCYNNRVGKDEITARFQASAAQWRDVAYWSDDRLAAQIREDRIDILFDLAGHTAHNRLLVIARRPAPIQITWAGYFGTTGLAAMDYLLADRHEVPPQAEVHYREKVLRMPDGYICYEPPAYAPPVADLPAWRRGYVTFGSFNNPAKLNSQVLELWAKLLERIPTARLLLKYKGVDNHVFGERLRGILAGQGIAVGRVEIQGGSAHADLLAQYNEVDIALDPFPYNGGLTTCEALWMGVPVITCPGETFASRHSLSHLSTVGLTETVARDLDEYVELAVTLAGDLPRLAALRASLRQRMVASPLCDGTRFATNLLALLRAAWRSWVKEPRAK